MNTGHDGSMGTIHSNSPRECLSRMESMIAMGGFALPQKTVREIIVGSVDIIIQAARLRDGSRRITHVTEVIGMEGEVIITQDLVVYKSQVRTPMAARSESTSLPASAARTFGTGAYYNEDRRLANALECMEERSMTGIGSATHVRA